MRTIRRQAKATSLDHAIELAKQHAKEQHRPSKVMADLMGVELKTYYRWLLDNTLPLNRIRHKAAMLKAEHPLEYDYSDGWTANYEQPAAELEEAQV